MIHHSLELNRTQVTRNRVAPLAPGAEFILEPPARRQIEIVSLFIQLDTDATAVNRTMVLEFGPAGQADLQIISPVVQPLNTVYNYYFMPRYGPPNPALYFNTMIMPLPDSYPFSIGEQVRTNIHNMQVGDQILIYTVRYRTWLAPVPV